MNPSTYRLLEITGAGRAIIQERERAVHERGKNPSTSFELKPGDRPVSPFHQWREAVGEIAAKKHPGAWAELDLQADRLKMWWRDHMSPELAAMSVVQFARGRALAERMPEPREAVRRAVALHARRHESGKNPSTSQQAQNRKHTPKRADYGFGLHVEYSPGNAAYFVMWHHEVLSIRPTWEAADEHARALVANKSKDEGGECVVHPSNKLVILRRTQSGEPHVVEHYSSMPEAERAAKVWMSKNPPGEHGHITIESRARGEFKSREFRTEPKNAFEWRWKS